MILLDIPQGVATLASAIFAAWIAVAGSVSVAAVGVALSFQRRLTAVEVELRELRNSRREPRFVYSRNIDPPGNPMKQERWDELLKKLELELLSDEEAQELKGALKQRRRQAREENDKTTMVIMSGALRATEVQIHLAELRNTPWWQNLLTMLGLRPDHHEIWLREIERLKRAEQIADLRLEYIESAPSIPQQRWDELCRKLENESLSHPEAAELYETLTRRFEKAKEEGDSETAERLSTARIFAESNIREVARKGR